MTGRGHRGFVFGALDVGVELGIINAARFDRDWLDRLEVVADVNPDLARVFPTNDRVKARAAHEALARAAADLVDLQPAVVEAQLSLFVADR